MPESTNRTHQPLPEERSAEHVGPVLASYAAGAWEGRPYLPPIAWSTERDRQLVVVGLAPDDAVTVLDDAARLLDAGQPLSGALGGQGLVLRADVVVDDRWAKAGRSLSGQPVDQIVWPLPSNVAPEKLPPELAGRQPLLEQVSIPESGSTGRG